jgi:phosphate/phosphite/phosphonate ABC transporter binding protein
MTEMAVFGYAARNASDERRERMARLSAEVGSRARIDIAVFEAKTYEELAASMHRGDVDFAWLPPIPLIALERKESVVPLVRHHRDGSARFHSVLVVHATSQVKTLNHLGRRHVAWVDPYSASGYVVPRIALAALGHDPRSLFAVEHFHHAHEAVVHAVATRTADVGATFAGLDPKGKVVRGPWMDMPEHERTIRVLTTFQAIPGDVIAARTELPGPTRDRLTRALIAIAHDASLRLLLRDVFGADELRRWTTDDAYAQLREAVMDASSKGLLEGEER